MDCSKNHLILGSQILNQESEALKKLSLLLNQDFNEAVELILGLKGRLGVTGVGKSGHVAGKVAATFSSTGTPAYFIHPVEAGHGDLGMVGMDDLIIAYSNSGETVELMDILQYCALYNIPVIGITKNSNSFLAKQSSVCLLLPNIDEACPLNCAPTTSTTMMMALGDSLALCALNAKGFDQNDFHRYHPGGKLGRQLMQVKDIMHSGDALPLVKTDTVISEVIYAITGKRLGCAGVLNDDDSLVGIITDGDLRRHMRADIMSAKASEIMTKNPVTLSADMLAAKALGVMREKSISNAFILQDGKAIGVIHIHDFLKYGLI